MAKKEAGVEMHLGITKKGVDDIMSRNCDVVQLFHGRWFPLLKSVARGPDNNHST
jgi:hypothetical protein